MTNKCWEAALYMLLPGFSLIAGLLILFSHAASPGESTDWPFAPTTVAGAGLSTAVLGVIDRPHARIARQV